MNNLLILNYDFRHEMQLEKSISQSSHSSRFPHGALIKERSHQTVTDPADPMNNLFILNYDFRHEMQLEKSISHK